VAAFAAACCVHQVWDLSSRKVIRSYEGHGGGVNTVLFHPDGTCIASGSTDGSLKVCEGLEAHSEGHCQLSTFFQSNRLSAVMRAAASSICFQKCSAQCLRYSSIPLAWMWSCVQALAPSCVILSGDSPNQPMPYLAEGHHCLLIGQGLPARLILSLRPDSSACIAAPAAAFTAMLLLCSCGTCAPMRCCSTMEAAPPASPVLHGIPAATSC